MKSKKIDALVNLSIFALWIIVSAILIVYSCGIFQMSALDVFIYSLTGWILNYAFGLFFHELGHVTFAKLCKMNIRYVNFGLFSIDYQNDKKIRPFTYFSPEAGETSFLPKEKMTKKHLKLIAGGGILFSVVYIVLCIIPLFFIENEILFCMLAIGACAPFYLLTVNLLPFDKTSDGSIIFSNRDYAEVIAEVANHQKALLENEMPEEAQIFKTSAEPLAFYYHYIYLILQNRREEAYNRIISLQPNLDNLLNDEYLLIFPEILYISLENAIDDEELKARAEIFFNEEARTPAILRAHRSFRRFYGDKDWADALQNSYVKSLSFAPNFIKRVEEQICAGVKKK